MKKGLLLPELGMYANIKEKIWAGTGGKCSKSETPHVPAQLVRSSYLILLRVGTRLRKEEFSLQCLARS